RDWLVVCPGCAAYPLPCRYELAFSADVAALKVLIVVVGCGDRHGVTRSVERGQAPFLEDLLHGPPQHVVTRFGETHLLRLLSGLAGQLGKRGRERLAGFLLTVQVERDAGFPQVTELALRIVATVGRLVE